MEDLGAVLALLVSTMTELVDGATMNARERARTDRMLSLLARRMNIVESKLAAAERRSVRN